MTMEPLGATTVFLVICVSCLLFSLWKKTSGSGNLPPGPVGFPLLGNVLQLNLRNLPGSLQKLSDKYGPVFTLSLGSERVVVLCGYQAVKEALVDHGEDFSGRGKLPVADILTKGTGIIFSNGEQWKQLRRFALTTLRNFGMGKKSIEMRIQEEARFLVERLRNTHGRPFDLTICLTHTVSNIICSIVFGDRFDYDDQKFLHLINLLQKDRDLARSLLIQVYNIFPTLMYYMPGANKKIFKSSHELGSFVEERVKVHKESLDPSCPRDFIDAFLIKMEEEQQNKQSAFNTDNLVRSTLDLFTAGTGTTSTTLKHGLLLLLKYPDVEEKVHQEIDCVIGRNRSPCMADRSQMPYTDAVIHEIQRFVNLVPLSVPHAVTRDIHFRGYVIPKGTTVFPSLESVLRDSKEFPNPEQFNPGHFLNENGDFKKSNFFMPFSTGKRICVGEGLARMELFLLLIVILQNFTLKPVIDRKDIDITSITSVLGRSPKPYQLCVLPR